MLNVGLTGNIASGKTMVAARLAQLGATVLDADTLAREAVAPGTAALGAIVARFGRAVVTGDGALDRTALGQLVFRDAAARRDLEAIVHPVIAQLRNAALEAARASGARIVVSEVPLLFEAGLAGEFDMIVLVDAPDEVRLDRLVRTRGMSEADARAVMAAQDDAVAKRPRADIVIENTGSPVTLERRVGEVWLELQRRSTARA